MSWRRATVWALTLAGVGLSATPARGWDVGLDRDEDWKSIYGCHVDGVDPRLKTDKNGNAIENTGSLHSGDKKLHGNEHAEIADHVLWMIDPKLGQMFGTRACQDAASADANCPRMVDLNASWLRRGLIHPTPKVVPDPNDAGDLPDTTLEERRFPPLAAWASLPDFSYTLYDWINERRLCPALPANADHFELCHEYSAWLGAALNSTHFGHLPMKVYARYHQIALSLAVRASALRKTLQAGNADVWHRDYVVELERLALAYEAAGQHFVEDRWSTGHMIARWGPGSYYDLPHVDGQPPQLSDAVMPGLLTGILHGSQAAFGKPDPLSAPLLDTDLPSGLVKLLLHGEMPHDQGTLARWRYVVDNKFSPPTQSQDGIGDYLFRSLMVGSYSGAYDEAGVQTVKVDPPIALNGAVNQRKGLVYCSAQGFRHVIAALSDSDPTLTTYGMLELPLPEPDKAELQYEWVPGADRLGRNPAEDDLCTRSWVTNDAWYMGIRTIAGQTDLPKDVAVGLWVKFFGDSPKYSPSVFRIFTSYTLARAEGLERVLVDQSHKHPDGSVAYGTDLAETSPTLYANGFWWHGNQNYDVPEYYEPANLDTLPERDEATGRDKTAIYGLFNKASVEYWCGQSLSADAKGATTGRLAELRDQIVSTIDDDATRKVLTAACSYLAERVEKRTDPSYTGPRTELMGEFLPFDKTPKYGDSYEPVCKFLDKSGLVVTTNDKDDTRPYFLHPGYVATPGKKGAEGHAAESLENWCKKIPVLDVTVASPDRDIVYTLDVTSSRWAMLEGNNLGKKPPSGKTGQVLAQDANGQWQPLNVWDEATKSTSGGWSDDGHILYARLPPSGLGFPTAATPQMSVEQLLALPPTHVPVRLVRALDKTANLVDVLSDGAETVGAYVIDVHPQVLRVQWAPVAAGTQEIHAEFCYPKWLRPYKQLLASGLYRLQNGAYTKLQPDPSQWFDDIPWQPNPNVTCDPPDERGGASITNPDPTVFDGTVVYVFAYH